MTHTEQSTDRVAVGQPRSMDDAVRALEAAAHDADDAPSQDDPGATAAQLFSTTEVREVLGKAVERQAQKQGTTRLGFDDLILRRYMLPAWRTPRSTIASSPSS